MINYLKENGAEMRWSTVPFGKYQGKTFPEIIVNDLDWFFWVVPKLYGRIAQEAQDLAQKARAIKVPNTRRNAWRSNIDMRWVIDSAALGSSKPAAPDIPGGRRDFHTSTCRGLFAEGSMTSERAAS